jgi:hypothetical protein
VHGDSFPTSASEKTLLLLLLLLLLLVVIGRGVEPPNDCSAESASSNALHVCVLLVDFVSGSFQCLHLARQIFTESAPGVNFRFDATASSALSVEIRNGSFAGALWFLRDAVVADIGVARAGIWARSFLSEFRRRSFSMRRS